MNNIKKSCLRKIIRNISHKRCIIEVEENHKKIIKSVFINLRQKIRSYMLLSFM